MSNFEIDNLDGVVVADAEFGGSFSARAFPVQNHATEFGGLLQADFALGIGPRFDLVQNAVGMQRVFLPACVMQVDQPVVVLDPIDVVDFVPVGPWTNKGVENQVMNVKA